jgi:hypothetical protein
MNSFGAEGLNSQSVDLSSVDTFTSILNGIEAPKLSGLFLRGNTAVYIDKKLMDALGGYVGSVIGEPRPDLIPGRDDSAHDVRFWNVSILGTDTEKRLVMADKPFDNTERGDAEREIAASAMVAELCGFNTFNTQLIINDQEGVRLLSIFEPTVRSLDNLAMCENGYGDESDAVSRLGGSLGIAASTLARLHSVGLVHGDVALKNLAISKRGDHHYPFVIDLEDAKFADPAKDEDRYIALVKKDISDLIADLKRKGWLEFGDGDIFTHFSELFLSQYLTQITHPANQPMSKSGKVGELIREVVSSVSEEKLK